MPSETPNLDFIVSRPQAYFQSEKSRRSEIQAMARSELATLRERVKQARNAALDEAKAVKGWHISKGGYENLAEAILALKGA